MDKYEKLLRENDEYAFEIQKFIDIASNIKDEELRTRINAQMIRTQIKLLEIIK